MGKYFAKKLVIYLATFFVAVTINWAVPRFMPGDPILSMIAQFQGLEGGQQIIQERFIENFGLDQSLIIQYFEFWRSLFRGDLGISLMIYPRPVFDIIKSSIIYDIIIVFPAVSLSWIVGNKAGAYSGFNKKADSFVMPFFYFLASSPYFWFAIVVVYVFGFRFGVFPTSHAYGTGMTPGFTLPFIINFIRHWFLPFFTMFLVGLGGWAIGMRNMIIYEKKANYSEYMKALGAKDKLVRRYAFRNGVLPQVTGLAIQLGTIISGAILVQMVFSYPGLGYRMVQAVQTQDFFLLQGCFLALITMALAANFIVDIVYMIIDPSIRASYEEEG